MNTALFVIVLVAAWSVLSIVVALAVGAMARARDVEPRFARPAQPARDEGFRAAV
jgi:hypothetical protein